MCGINGIINLKGNGNFGNEVRRMNNALAHRGPNDEGMFEENGIALGHRRLSIIDLSSAGHQPMHFENGRFTIVYNGELYNFKELKADLTEFNFQTATDTEVILASYVKWGKNCLEHFNGMFAFAIRDNENRNVFIARDRLGIKPLYYSIANDDFIFSSEIRSLLASGKVKRKMNANAIGDYLRYQTVHAPATIIENVKMLMPGHYISIEKSTVTEKCWWNPKLYFDKEMKKLGAKLNEVFPADLSTGFKGKSFYEEKCIAVRKLLRDAVECRLVADVPFGAFLSGGIDSSVIVGLMSEVSKTPVNTFTITFDDSEFSEAIYAKKIAEKFKTIHHEIKLKPEDFLADLPNALDAMDHPSGDGPNTYVVSKATKKAGITMALSGLGGDELFCGYDIFKRANELENKKWMNAIPAGLRKVGGNALKKIKPGVAGEKMAAVLSLKKIDFASYYPLSRQVLLDEQVQSILNSSEEKNNSVQEIAERIEKEFPGKAFLMNRVTMAEISTYMQNVLLRDTDQMSMANALEVRVPFLDYRLLEHVLDLSDAIKFPVTSKKLLVDACKDLLPDEIVNRPKMGFTFPWKNWMKNELKSFCEERLMKLGKRNSFNENGIMKLWNSFLNDDPRVTWSRVWPLVVLSHWLEKNGIED